MHKDSHRNRKYSLYKEKKNPPQKFRERRVNLFAWTSSLESYCFIESYVISAKAAFAFQHANTVRKSSIKLKITGNATKWMKTRLILRGLGEGPHFLHWIRVVCSFFVQCFFWVFSIIFSLVGKRPSYGRLRLMTITKKSKRKKEWQKGKVTYSWWERNDGKAEDRKERGHERKAHGRVTLRGRCSVLCYGSVIMLGRHNIPRGRHSIW